MKDTIVRLLDYELWANKQLIQALQSIPSPPGRAVQVLGHVLSAQQVWFNRIQGDINQVPVWQDILIEQMLPKATEHHQLMSTYLSGINEGELTQMVLYKNSKEEEFQNTLLDILLQLSHHAAYHRGQVVQLIRPFLAEVPATDYIVWIRGNHETVRLA